MLADVGIAAIGKFIFVPFSVNFSQEPENWSSFEKWVNSISPHCRPTASLSSSSASTTSSIFGWSYLSYDEDEFDLDPEGPDPALGETDEGFSAAAAATAENNEDEPQEPTTSDQQTSLEGNGTDRVQEEGLGKSNHDATVNNSNDDNVSNNINSHKSTNDDEDDNDDNNDEGEDIGESEVHSNASGSIHLHLSDDDSDNDHDMNTSDMDCDDNNLTSHVKLSCLPENQDTSDRVASEDQSAESHAAQNADCVKPCSVVLVKYPADAEHSLIKVVKKSTEQQRTPAADAFFTCPFCSYRHKSAKSLQIHKFRIHFRKHLLAFHSKPGFGCSECCRKYRGPDQLLRHQSEIHPYLAPENYRDTHDKGRKRNPAELVPEKNEGRRQLRPRTPF